MAEYDGEVVISARIDTQEIDGDLDKVRASLGRQRQVLANLQQQYDDFVSGLIKTPEQLGLEKAIKREEAELKRAMKELAEITPDYTLLKNQQRYTQLPAQEMEAFKKLEADVNKFNERIADSNKQLNTLNQRLAQVKLNPEATTSVTKLKENIDKLSAKSLDMGSNIAKSQFNGLNKIGDGLSRTVSIMGKGLGSAFKGLIAPLNMGINLLQSFGRQIVSIGKTAFILHGLRTGFRGISESISNVIASDNIFSVSLNQIKSNLATAFYPIYQFILPALQSLMSALSTASSYLAQFISHLFGQNYQAMQAGAKTFLETANAADKSSKSLSKSGKVFSELGKDIKKAKGELASFDKINVLQQKNSEKGDKQKAPSFEFMPTTNFDARYDQLLKGFDAFREKWQARLQPTIDSFKELGETVKTKLGGFAKQAIIDFNNEFLEPAITDLTTKGIPRFNQITQDMINNTDWDNLNNSLKDFWASLLPFSEVIGDGLLDFYEKVLKPLGEWAVGQVVPAALKILSGALDVLTPILKEVQKQGWLLWDTFLAPVAGWTGGVIVDVLNDMGEALKGIGAWIKENSWFVEIVASLIIGITAALVGYNAVLWVTNGGFMALAGSIWGAVSATAAWTAAMLANPITWIVLAIGGLIAALILVAKHWDEVKDAASKAINWIKDKLKGFGDWIWEHGGKQISQLFSWIPRGNASQTLTIGPQRPPGFAQGAVLQGGNPMLAYLNDQPRGQVNIETPLNTMLEAFTSALDQRQGMANNNVVIQADGDINGIVSLLNFKIKERDNILGNNYIQDGVFA